MGKAEAMHTGHDQEPHMLSWYGRPTAQAGLDLCWTLACDLCSDRRCGRRIVVVTTEKFGLHANTVYADLLEKVECGRGQS